ncbi:hypothetical protein LguiB_018068 [Lonicera macranthoides]
MLGTGQGSFLWTKLPGSCVGFLVFELDKVVLCRHNHLVVVLVSLSLKFEFPR